MSDDGPDASTPASNKDPSSSKANIEGKHSLAPGQPPKQPKSRNPRQPSRGGGAAPKKAGPKSDGKKKDSNSPAPAGGQSSTAQDAKPIKVLFTECLNCSIRA